MRRLPRCRRTIAFRVSILGRSVRTRPLGVTVFARRGSCSAFCVSAVVCGRGFKAFCVSILARSSCSGSFGVSRIVGCVSSIAFGVSIFCCSLRVGTFRMSDKTRCDGGKSLCVSGITRSRGVFPLCVSCSSGGYRASTLGVGAFDRFPVCCVYIGGPTWSSNTDIYNIRISYNII